MKEIPLHYKGEIVGRTLVSDHRHIHLSQHKWSLSFHNYAYRTERGKIIYMHREILGLAEGDKRQADHIDRDRLNNIDSNLRIVTSAEQNQNLGVRTSSKSGYRGISWDSTRGKWRAVVSIDGKYKQIGRYSTKEEAVEAVSTYRKKHMPYATD